jgi:hypothetical protein
MSMRQLGYRWTTIQGGQYVDGQEIKDIVDYHQITFLLRWMSIEEQTWKWKENWLEEDIGE